MKSINIYNVFRIFKRNTPAISWLYLFDSTKIHLLFQVRSLTTLKHGLHSVRSLHDHSPMGFSGHFVALFRQPEQRLLSAWYDDEDVFRAEPQISRCAVNRTAERYLTMEEFIEKSLGFFLSVYSPTSPFACYPYHGWSRACSKLTSNQPLLGFEVLKRDKDWKNTTGVHTNQIFVWIFSVQHMFMAHLWQ